VGDFGAPSIERLLAAQPTLVLEVDLADESIGGQIDRLGIRRLRVACRGLYDIPEAIRQVGGAMGLEDRAGPLADELERQIAALRRESAALTNRPAVFVEIWGDPLTTAGKGSFVSDLVYLAGGRNIADEAGTDYFQVSPEWVVARNPEVMLCLYMADKTDTRQQVLTRPGWAGVTAVRTGRVRGGLNNDLLLRPGPRVLEGVRALRAAIGAPGQTP
jgi:iron complex transport system substrate-binding protein